MTKPWYQSITIMAALAYSVLDALESQGVIPAGGTQAIATLAQNSLVVLGAFGLRRAIG